MGNAIVSLPSFETPRLLLRPRSLADTEACLAMDHEPEVTRFVDGPWSDPTEHRAFIEERSCGPYAEGLGYWTILRRADDAFIGWVLLIPCDAVGPDIEIGWRLRPQVWGQGYATEAALPLVRHGFETLELDEIIAEVDEHNLASRRVAAKLGMTQIGIIGGKTRNLVRYVALRSRIKADEATRAPCARHPS
jgi:RimJ/RimL family protein N-acetyltransferase